MNLATDEEQAAYRAALDSAVRSLGQREHSRKELERKLQRKGHDDVLIARVMGYLWEHDLQSDTRFAESFVRSRIRRCFGPIKIRQELSSRGVLKEDLEGELEEQLTRSSEFWMNLAEEGLAKKYGAPPDSREAWATQARYLARRGFPSDLIYKVLGSQSD